MLVSSFGACQQNNSKTLKSDTNQNKNMNNEMLNLYKHVKTYPDQPWYEIEYSQDACGYEILVNDLPITRYFLFGTANEQRIQINGAILHSGKQTITIRMFPPQLSDKSYSPALVDASKLKIKVLHRKSNNGAIEDYKTDFEFISPLKQGTEKFSESGQKFFEFKGTFEAVVPYNVEGWKNSKDLTKEDHAELEKQALTACNKYRNILKNKNVNELASLVYGRELELASTYYWSTPNDSKERWDDLKQSVMREQKVPSISGFKMVFYGDGKIVALVPTVELYKDYYTVVQGNTKEDDFDYSFFLHKKAGSNELTPIR